MLHFLNVYEVRAAEIRCGLLVVYFAGQKLVRKWGNHGGYLNYSRPKESGDAKQGT
jgi:hypothetical protein